jgi:hypothetical protein
VLAFSKKARAPRASPWRAGQAQTYQSFRVIFVKLQRPLQIFPRSLRILLFQFLPGLLFPLLRGWWRLQCQKADSAGGYSFRLFQYRHPQTGGDPASVSTRRAGETVFVTKRSAIPLHVVVKPATGQAPDPFVVHAQAETRVDLLVRGEMTVEITNFHLTNSKNLTFTANW